MSFLNLRKKKKVEQAETPKHLAVASSAVAPVALAGRPSAFAGILRRPRITEKALTGQARGIYAFEVSPKATKDLIARAVSALYQVKPVKVTVVSLPTKRITVRGKGGFSGGGKKAYVYLKKGDKIELV